MRFCLVSTQRHWGGGEALLLAMAKELARAAHSVSWIARGESEVAERLLASDQRVLHLLRGRGANLRDWRATLRVLRTTAPDIVILNDTHAVPLVGSASWFCRSPKPLRLAYKHTVFPLRSKLKYRLLADKLICVSAAARETLVRGGLPPEQSLVIYGGCQPPGTQSTDRALIRGELGLPADRPLAVCVGNLLECKGHLDLIQAMAELVESEPKLLLVIAGEGVERVRLEQKIREHHLEPNVRLLGYREDAERLLAAADFVVHPSHAEGLSLVLIQAQMLGKPIVATAVGGTVEVLQAGEQGKCSSWIAAPKQPRSLAEQMRLALTAIRADADALAAGLERSAERARRMFDIRTNTQQLADQCSRLLTAGHPAAQQH